MTRAHIHTCAQTLSCCRHLRVRGGGHRDHDSEASFSWKNSRQHLGTCPMITRIHGHTHTATAEAPPTAGVGFLFFSGVPSPTPGAGVYPETLLTAGPWLCGEAPGVPCPPGNACPTGLSVVSMALCCTGSWPGPWDWHKVLCLCSGHLPSYTWQMCPCPPCLPRACSLLISEAGKLRPGHQAHLPPIPCPSEAHALQGYFLQRPREGKGLSQGHTASPWYRLTRYLV